MKQPPDLDTMEGRLEAIDRAGVELKKTPAGRKKLARLKAAAEVLGPNYRAVPLNEIVEAHKRAQQLHRRARQLKIVANIGLIMLALILLGRILSA